MSVLEPIIDVVVRRAAETPGRVAFVFADGGGDVVVTWGQLGLASAFGARVLADAGVGPGAVVALVLPTSPELVSAIFACQRAGCVPMVVSPNLPRAAIARRLAMVQAAACIVGRGEAGDGLGVRVIDASRFAGNTTRMSGEGGREAAVGPNDGAVGARVTRDDDGAVGARVTLDDLAYLQLTSGTSGESRAVPIRYRQLAASLATSRQALGFSEAEVFVGWVPLYHDLGLVRFVFAPVDCGGRCHLLPPSIGSLRGWLETVTREGGTVTGAPDFAWRIATRVVPPDGIDLRTLKVATNGGEPVRASTIERFEARFGVPGLIRPGYGMAEATLGVTTLLPGEAMRVDAKGHVSCGRVYPCVELRVVAADGRLAASGASGTIELRGAAVFDGYHGESDAARRAARDADGWWPTGDSGALDADGHLYVFGRTRAMIKRAGALIAPREVEEAAESVRGVKASAAVGVLGAGDAASSTEEVVVVVEVADELLADAGARESMRGAVSAAVEDGVGVRPRVELVGPKGIPRTANGKVQHAVLRASLEGGRAT